MLQPTLCLFRVPVRAVKHALDGFGLQRLEHDTRLGHLQMRHLAGAYGPMGNANWWV